jgi:hypothetical protein
MIECMPCLLSSIFKLVFMQKNATTADMKTLASCINKLVLDGYTEDFKASERGLLALQHERLYEPQHVNVVNFYRFEGASDPADNSILYVIETNDGIKGTLVDAYGPYADIQVQKFMEEVESANINKKAVHSDTTTS